MANGETRAEPNIIDCIALQEKEGWNELPNPLLGGQWKTHAHAERERNQSQGRRKIKKKKKRMEINKQINKQTRQH
jgi:hypothetical protein